MIWAMVPGGVFMIVMLAAAVTRRLHDTGLTGLVGLVPILLAIAAGRWMIDVFDRPPDMLESGLFFQSFALNAAYNISLIVLVVLLCRASAKRDNRYGPAEAAP
jgi:uncharacterized membrane protein YhaH (DUF805 family)